MAHKYLSLLLMLLASGLIYAQTCPEIEAPAILNPQDVSSVQQLNQNFLTYHPDIRLRPERNRLLMSFAFANQQYVVDTFYAKYCGLVREDRFQLSAQQQVTKLTKAESDLYFRVPFPPPIIDTRVNISAIPDELKDPQQKESQQNSFVYASYVNSIKGEPLPIEPNVALPTDSNNLNPWLKAPPYVVTAGNKYFVIVSSVRTYAQAIQEVKRLKRKASELDYVVYGPYQDNPYHAIMVATWLSKDEAQIALEQTKEALNMDARIWWCPNEGEEC